MKEVYNVSIADTIKLLDRQLHDDFIHNLDEAVAYIRNHDDFETFDRYTFGREHLNKLTEKWRDIRVIYGFEAPKSTALNLDAPTFFEENSFNIDAFRSPKSKNPTEKQIALGARLFNDVRLSASGNLSCVSCHNPSNAYQDGLPKALDKDGNMMERNTPTVINTIYQRKFFWDGRSDNLEQQITNVFDNEGEFNNNAHSIKSSEILDDETYQKLIEEAYPNTRIDRNTLIRALAAYTSTLNAMNSRFDKNMRGETDDFTEQEILGMNLFMGKALCATCHFIPLTNGTVPPAFFETEKEVLGTPQTAENKKLDPDRGFFWFFQEEIHDHMFKTPTVRNVELTAPYMHNGVYNTLEEVMVFYNKGGGAGMGFDVPNQTLPFDSLSLSTEEIDALVAFMKTFTDTNIGSAEAYSLQDDMMASE